jgi:F-type H+-transporting ATPase subunit gamma
MIVHENDCLYQARKSAACYAERQTVRYRKLWYSCPFYAVLDSLMTVGPVEIFQNAKPEEAPQRKLFVVISSDKGLCGGIHSSVSKATRRSINTGENGGSTDSPIVVIGDKSKAQLSRSLSSNLAITFNQIGRDIPTFADAAGVADLIVKSGIKYDAIAIVYNRFISAISYESAVVEVLDQEVLKETGGWSGSLII